MAVNRKAVVAADLPQHLSASVDLRAAAERAKAKAANVCGEEVASTDTGFSLLELKNHVMLDYLCDLAYIFLRKCSGKSISSEAAVERAVEARTVLEKLRPLEKKLRYQIDKSVAAAERGGLDEDDPLRHRPDADELIGKLGDDEEEETEDQHEGRKASSGKYVAPKHVPAYFDEEDEQAAVETGSGANARRARLSRGVLEEMRGQHLDTPEEITEQSGLTRRKRVQELREVRRYEEEHFMRLPVTKKDKAAARRGGRVSTVADVADEVTAFGRSFFSEKNDEKKMGKKRKKLGAKAMAKSKFKRRK